MQSLSALALLARRLELISRLPGHGGWHGRSLPAKNEPKSGELGIAAKVHRLVEFIRGLMVVMGLIILHLVLAPFRSLPFKQRALIDGERRNSGAGKAEM